LENPKYNPHVDGIVGSTQTKVTNLATSQMQKLTIQQPATGSASDSTTPTTHYLDVHYVKINTSKGPQQPNENKKGKGKKESGANNKKSDNNAKGGKDEKRKVKFP
jgi:hypothetical protein